MLVRDPPLELAGKWVLAAIAAVVATIAIIGLFEGNARIVIVLVGTFVMGLALMFSGNPRLFCLWGLILSAPLNLNKSFFVVAHMGGAGAIHVDLVDVFMVPLLFFLARDLSQGHLRKIRVSGFAVIWLGLVALGLFDIVRGPMRSVALLEVVRMLKMLLLFLIIINEVVRVRQFTHVFWALMAGVGLQAGIGLIQYVFQVNLGAQMFGEGTQENMEFTSRATYNDASQFTYRIGALFGHPNLLAVYLMMNVSIGIAMLFCRISALAKFFVASVVVLGIVATVLTLSRSGWISLAVACSLILAISFTHPRLRRQYVFARIGAIVAGLLLVGVMSGPIIKRITQSDVGAVDFRWEWMAVSWAMIQEKPVLGFGLNSFTWQMPPYTKYQTYEGVMDKYGENLPVVHNIYLLVWSEQGTVGLVLFLALHVYLFRIAFQNLRRVRDPTVFLMSMGAIAGVFGLMADGMASFFIKTGGCDRVFMVSSALVVAAHYWQREQDRISYRYQQVVGST